MRALAIAIVLCVWVGCGVDEPACKPIPTCESLGYGPTANLLCTRDGMCTTPDGKRCVRDTQPRACDNADDLTDPADSSEHEGNASEAGTLVSGDDFSSYMSKPRPGPSLLPFTRRDR